MTIGSGERNLGPIITRFSKVIVVSGQKMGLEYGVVCVLAAGIKAVLYIPSQ